MYPVLIVEDERPIADLIALTLRRMQYTCIQAHSGEQAADLILTMKFDLILLDVMLPGIDGTELLGRMRASTSLRRIPVIMATAKGAEYDRVRALDGGADDYLTKPFSVIELVSRVKAVLRRCQPEGDSSILRSGEVSLDTRAHTVLSGGERVDLTYKEYELLRLFLSHPGTAYTRDRLMELVWGMDYCGESRTVDMHIRTLRQKLGKAGAHITTVRGVGYRWEETI